MISQIRKITGQLWGAIVAGGLISILFGLATMLWPHTVLSIFIYIFSAFVIIVSVVVLGRAVSEINDDRLWWLSMLFAICGISVGIYITMNPEIAQGLIAVLLAIYIFTQSLMDLIVASYTDDPQSKTPMLATGVIGVVFGFMVLFNPMLATDAMVWVIGLYILIHGVLVEYCSIRIRHSVKQVARDVHSTIDDVQGDIEEAQIVNKKSKHTAKKPTAKKKK